MTRAASIEEIQPLVDLCRAGKLFDVQEWIKAGKPVALPENPGPKGTRRNPIRVAMECGFHSLVQVLLEAGAPICQGSYDALEHAVEMRRPDLAALLFENCAKAEQVSMCFVMDMWNSEMLDLFLANGGDLNAEYPVAWALIHKIRPALGLLKRLGETQPSIMAQAEIALRSHAYKGNLKWVSLLLWAGADPWKRGPDRIEDIDDDVDDESEHLCAVELAAFAGQIDVLKLKKISIAPDSNRPEAMKLIEQATHADDSKTLLYLLEQGHRPDMLPDFGTRAIESLLNCMTWDFNLQSFSTFGDSKKDRRLDSSRARECMKMIHILAANGAKWVPESKEDITEARRNLLKMKLDYSLEFIWLMKTYSAARRRGVQDLFRTPAIGRLLGHEREHANLLIAQIPEKLPNDTPDATM